MENKSGKKTKKILVIDDEKDICEFVKWSLQKTGEFTVVTTSDPTEAEKLCVREKPDLVLVDVVMPEMSGLEVIEAIKANPKINYVKIIVSSGGGEMIYLKKEEKWSWEPNTPIVEHRTDYIDEKNPEHAAELYGVDDYLRKPYPPAFLLQVIREVLSK